jgi:hypothetical protein
VVINDPSNWVSISGSLAAPIRGASPPFQYNDPDVHTPYGQVPLVNVYDLFTTPPGPGSPSGYSFSGLAYVGPMPFVGVLPVNWTTLLDDNSITVSNQNGVIATKQISIDYAGDSTTGTFNVSLDASSTEIYITNLMPLSWNGIYPGWLAVSFGVPTPPATGGTTGGTLGGSGGRRVWRPRANRII